MPMWREIATGAVIGALCFIAGYLTRDRRGTVISIRRNGSLEQARRWDEVEDGW